MSVEIIKQTPGWLAVLKPPGMSVHNEADLDLISVLKQKLGSSEIHLINRLDAPVGGVLLVGLNPKTSKTLHEAFAQRKVKKTYLAVGEVSEEAQIPAVGEKGLWKWSLSKRAESRRDPRGYGPLRVPCTSTWEVLATKDRLVLLRLSPETGRKHQLRRHAALAKWPLVGDHRYGRKDQTEENIRLFALELEFEDPESGDPVAVRGPMPEFTEPFSNWSL